MWNSRHDKLHAGVVLYLYNVLGKIYVVKLVWGVLDILTEGQEGFEQHGI